MSSAAAPHPLFAARQRSGAMFDAVIAAVALAGSMAQLSHGGIAGSQTGPGDLDWAGGALAACSSVPLIAWRHAPGAVFASTALASAVLVGLGYPLALALGPAVALYLLAASRDEEDPWTRANTGMALGLFVAYLGAASIGGGGFPGTEFLHTGLAWAVGWFAGDRTRLRHEHIVELAEGAARTEREAERERLLAVAEERARIARDLHDAAGHAINVIAVRAGAARMRRDPERSQATLNEIEKLARRTAGEIDQIVGTLRERGNGSVEAPPGLASVDSLVASHTAAGLAVSVERRGRARRLSGAADQAAYRILQESLTNAARHGTGSAEVELAFDGAGLELTVSNEALEDSPARSNGGHGLIGMSERAALVGGDLEVQRAAGSFLIRARIPYDGGDR